MGTPHRPDHRRQRQRDLRAERRRGPQRLVHDRHQHRGQQISARTRSARPSAKPASRQLVTRVAETIRDWGMNDGYFRTAGRRRHFPRRTRAYPRCASTPPSTRRSGSTSDATASSPIPTPKLALEPGQRNASNSASPATSTPQCSACFINSVKDSLDSILTLAKTEGMLFKWGSGTGTNLSPLRSSTEGSQRRRHRQRSAQLHERL